MALINDVNELIRSEETLLKKQLRRLGIEDSGKLIFSIDIDNKENNGDFTINLKYLEYALINQHRSYRRGKIESKDSKIKKNPRRYRVIFNAFKRIERKLTDILIAHNDERFVRVLEESIGSI